MKFKINKEFNERIKEMLIQMVEILRIDAIFVVETIREL